MKIEYNTGGITPTAEFIDNQHTGKFIEILPNTFMIKGAINDRGFDQGYALKRGKSELLLIDVVEEATKEAVTTIVKDRYEIKAILITSKSVLQDAYADLATISEEAGGADIYLHPEIDTDDDFETKRLTDNDSLLKSFNLDVHKLPSGKEGAVLIYSDKNDGMLFTGDSAKGSQYDTDSFVFTREKQEKKDDEFELARDWQNYDKDFTYLLPRQGKPALEINRATKANILNWLSRGGS